MTLRMTVEIVPFGVEEDKRALCEIEAWNIEEIRNLGFGHVICKYGYRLTKMPIGPYDDEEVLYQGVIAEHDRRDGALELVRKVLSECESL